MSELDIAIETLNMARTTLIATVMNLDVNIQILNENIRYHNEASAGQKNIENLLTEILNEIKNK